MTEIEKAKRLGHLFYIMRKEHTQEHHRDIKKRDVMALGVIQAAIDEQADGLVKMSDVSAFFRITPAAVSQMVREYERKGWIKRVIWENDRRCVYLKVTKAGRSVLKNCEESAMQEIVDFIHYLGEEDSDALIRILEKAKDYGPFCK